MHAETHNILAVNPGVRYLGIAIFRGLELRDWRVRTFGRTPMPRKLNAVATLLSEIIGRHAIDGLVMKRVHPSRSSGNLARVAETIRTLARTRGISYREFTIEELKRLLSPGRILNKLHLMEEAAARYPFLFTEMEREQRHKNPYLVRMFEAVALGIVCVNAGEAQRKVALTNA